MEFIKRSEPVWLALVVLGALNWGIVGLFDTNVVEEILGTGTAADVVYVVIGLAGLAMIPRLLEELRMGTHRAPRRRLTPGRAGRGCTPGAVTCVCAEHQGRRWRSTDVGTPASHQPLSGRAAAATAVFGRPARARHRRRRLLAARGQRCSTSSAALARTSPTPSWTRNVTPAADDRLGQARAGVAWRVATIISLLHRAYSERGGDLAALRRVGTGSIGAWFAAVQPLAPEADLDRRNSGTPATNPPPWLMLWSIGGSCTCSADAFPGLDLGASSRSCAATRSTT